MVVDQATYRIHSRDPAFVYVEPVRPGAFDDTISGTAGNVLQQRRVAEHKKRVEDYEVFQGVKQGLREKILFAVDGQYLKGMKEPLVGYANRSPRELLTHLFDNCIQRAIDINVLEEALNDEWETDDHITEFYRKMDEKRAKVERAGVVISDSQICLKVVKRTALDISMKSQ
ncbi:hypothetical protein ACHAW6_006804 [Cyclotella cf. meneghiniana]